ncbi:MAG: RiPP maturation radical SAM C-methyltransferase [Actinomycetota bacterium]|nr:RiPP maturation radical SAM C-methyltransferase [Actinomycetota bacterium]
MPLIDTPIDALDGPETSTVQGSNATSKHRLRVALVDMPFASTRLPSIQLGLLQAIVLERGFEAQTLYLNLRFGARIGWEAYEALCDQRRDQLGEWIFSLSAFGEEVPASAAYVERFRDDLQVIAQGLGRDVEYLVDLREQVAPAFLEECLETVPWAEYDVVGIGSVFQQNCAGIALARRLKERFPHLVTVFGGANFEDQMGLEYVRTLPWIDYAVIGEGDEVFPALLERVARGDQLVALTGLASQAAGVVQFSGRAPSVTVMDGLPTPAYDDYFDEAIAVGLPGLVGGRGINVPFETARGCWWGAKHHCTFCGLNGLGMAYRSKSPEKALACITELARRHSVYSLVAVDNILDHRYIQGVFQPLVEQRYDFNLFYEVKANLTQEQLRLLARAGVRRIQPGIESLSTRLLGLMRKGTTALQNVRLLKWCEYYGIQPAWNILHGFPGEKPEDYEAQFAVMKLIPHLTPPDVCGELWLERNSPNFTDADAFGITDVRPDAAYHYIYPGRLDHGRIAYFFEYTAFDTVPAAAHQPWLAYVEHWKELRRSAGKPYLGYLRGPDRTTVFDRRDGQEPRVHVFKGDAALAFDFCGPTYHSVDKVREHLRLQHGRELSHEAVLDLLRGFTDLGLMLEEGGHYLSLALPGNANW